MTNCIHPGGQFILEAVNGRDIGCYFYGGYALESSGFKPYDHTAFAMSYLEKNFIGTIHNELIQDNNLIIDRNSENKNWVV